MTHKCAAECVGRKEQHAAGRDKVARRLEARVHKEKKGRNENGHHKEEKAAPAGQAEDARHTARECARGGPTETDIVSTRTTAGKEITKEIEKENKRKMRTESKASARWCALARHRSDGAEALRPHRPSLQSRD